MASLSLLSVPPVSYFPIPKSIGAPWNRRRWTWTMLWIPVAYGQLQILEPCLPGLWRNESWSTTVSDDKMADRLAADGLTWEICRWISWRDIYEVIHTGTSLIEEPCLLACLRDDRDWWSLDLLMEFVVLIGWELIRLWELEELEGIGIGLIGLSGLIGLIGLMIGKRWLTG